jgi:putative DNA primase/helicase
MNSVIEQFRSALAGRGIIPPPNLLGDGKLRRCDAEGRNGKNDAAYVLHLDGIPAGGFENHRDGKGWETWRGDIGRQPTQAEEKQNRERIESAQKARAAEDARRRTEAATKAAGIWQGAAPASPDHPYLKRKGVGAHGLRVSRDALVIPMRDATGALRSLQFIQADGTKRFLFGGQVAGCYFGIGKPHGVLCVAEGFATGASIYEATGYAVAVAFNAGNLLPVAKALREKYPEVCR